MNLTTYPNNDDNNNNNKNNNNIGNTFENDINTQATNVIYIYIYIYIYMEHPFLMFLDHTQRRNTVARTPLDE